ncbi:hypothetical protein [Secundilactobacillus folii]|uniref:Lipoprotein n=1 Tax=Secundilactobacillus folii TaxID=2678357 RepID=A0A7X3C2U8_9LACO|nr:hypothetical protein [Secundilactobacillus folii]MTV81931.1 hypothetical protein [Secundilactobacillus folii]
MAFKQSVKLVLAMTACMCLVLLGSCGQQTNAAKANKVAFVTTAQNQQKQVWYLLDAGVPQSDSQVKAVLVTQNGKVTTYPTTKMSLTKVANKSVKQVVSTAKSNGQVNRQRTLNSRLKQFNAAVKLDQSIYRNAQKDGWKKGISQTKSQLESDQKQLKLFRNSTKSLKFKSPTAFQLSARVHKNQAGKQIVGETIRFKYNNWFLGSQRDGRVRQVTQHQQISLGTSSLMGSPVTVSKVKYIGYLGSKATLMTATQNGKAKSNFDTPTVKGVR